MLAIKVILMFWYITLGLFLIWTFFPKPVLYTIMAASALMCAFYLLALVSPVLAIILASIILLVFTIPFLYLIITICAFGG